MEQNISVQEYFKTTQYLYQMKNTLNILFPQLGLIQGNLMECQKKIFKI